MKSAVMTIDCSVYIVTLNCEQWILRTLQSVQNFKEVILVDSGSTDSTLTIAKTFANVKIYQQAWLGYSKQKAFALSLCGCPWVLNLDGDEELSTLLQQEIATASTPENKSYVALNTPILDFFMGVKNSENTKLHRKVRCFKRELGQYDVTHAAHEGVMVQGDVKNTQGVIYHYGEDSINTKVAKNNQYSSLKAQEKFAKNKHFHAVKLVLVMPLTFVKSYIFRRNFLNGWRGFISSMVNAFYAFLKEAKLYELNLKQANKKLPTTNSDQQV